MTAWAVPRGWTPVEPVGGDASGRCYLRVAGDSGTAIFMQAAPDDSPRAVPGHRISDYVKISAWLRAIGLRAPEVYEADPGAGTMLVEDLGTTSFRKALAEGVETETLYTLAQDVLRAFSDHPPPLPLPDYFGSPVHRGRARIADWFIPLQKKRLNPDGLTQSFEAIWDTLESALPAPRTGFLHIDFHLDNLMWCPEEKGLKRCGLLDFQGGRVGPFPYDLTNLLEDVRGDVPDALARAMLDRGCKGLSPGDAESFRLWYRVLGTQFHCRVAGQFIKMAIQDGKSGYLTHLPRTLALLRRGLEHPVLAPVRHWFAENAIDLMQPPEVNPQEGRAFIRPDAF